MGSSNWDTLAVDYDSHRTQKSILVPTRNDIVDYLYPLVEQNPTLRILDIGCATGQLLEDIHTSFPQAILFGIDKSELMCRFAQSKETTANVYNLDIMKTEITRLIGSESVDVVICSHVMPYLPNKALAFQRIQEVLKSEGTLILIQATMETMKDKLAANVLWAVSDKATYLSQKEFGLIASRYFEVDTEFFVGTNGFSPSIVGHIMVRK